MTASGARRPKLKIVNGRHGREVVTASTIRTGDVVLEFHGPRLEAGALGEPMHCLQVGPDTYLGRSGGPDDFVDHSCAPNCGVREHDGRFFLVALRTVMAGRPITFDHSTTMAGGRAPATCHCGEHDCRGTIGDFWSLPHALRKRYLTRGIVLPHVVRARPRIAAAPAESASVC